MDRPITPASHVIAVPLIGLLAFFSIRPYEMDVFLGVIPQGTATAVALLAPLLALLAFRIRTPVQRQLAAIYFFFILLAAFYSLLEITILGNPYSKDVFLQAVRPLIFVGHLVALSLAIGEDPRLLDLHAKALVLSAILMVLLMAMQDHTLYGTRSPSDKPRTLFTTFGIDKNTYAFAAGIAASLVYRAIYRVKGRAKKFGLVLLCMGLLLAASVVGSRTVFIIHAVIALDLLIRHPFIASVLGVGLLMVATIFFSKELEIIDKVIKILTTKREDSDNMRMMLLTNSLTMAAEAFFLGNGPYEAKHSNKRIDVYIEEHNETADFLNTYGIFFLFPFIFTLALAIHRHLRSRDWYALGMTLASIASFMTTPFMSYYAMSLWLVQGVCRRVPPPAATAPTPALPGLREAR